jgi:nitric oxide reductase subunit C
VPYNNRVFYNRLILFLLSASFLIYNYIVYTDGAYLEEHRLSDQAITGEKIWQRKNCSACHQIYGLGGYLGPDLTNIYSLPGKGPEYINGILNTGIKHMPLYHFNEKEKEALIAFLKAVDATGYYPNDKAKFIRNGWVEIKLKEPRNR